MDGPAVKPQDQNKSAGTGEIGRNVPPPGLPQVPRSLAEVEDNAWQLLRRGVKDRRSAFHTLTVGTISEDGAPEMRIVVLREVDRGARLLRFNTDMRSPKFQQLQTNPKIALIGYDPRRKVSLRMTGYAAPEAGTEVVRAVWAGMKSMSRDCYRVGLPPSSPIPTPEESPLQDIDEDQAFENFALVDVTLTRLEWLYLRHGGHMRARFDWPEGTSADADPEASWLVA